MPSSLDNLNASLALVDAQILALSALPPVDYSLDGESVNLSRALADLLKARADLINAIIQAEGPSEYHATGTT